MFENLSNSRQQGKITYSIKAICVTSLFALLCGITSINSLTHTFNNDFTISNLSKIINDVFDDLNIDELRRIQKYIVNTIIRSKIFNKFKYNGCLKLLVDGTG